MKSAALGILAVLAAVTVAMGCGDLPDQSPPEGMENGYFSPSTGYGMSQSSLGIAKPTTSTSTPVVSTDVETVEDVVEELVEETSEVQDVCDPWTDPECPPF